jgi:hypothetical protein
VVFEYGASLIVALRWGLQVALEGQAWAAIDCQPFGRFGCGAADPFVAAVGLRWSGTRGGFASVGVGRAFRRQNEDTELFDTTAAWLPFVVFGYTWTLPQLHVGSPGDRRRQVIDKSERPR